ncbi:plasmid replication protein RepC [Cereibacter azotoformans]|uniref:Replication initiation protein RepC n=1 Tax=Cereibacter azotoformans TaxID=43057 RepID=A0A2T5JSY0_9RHOB|nr:plasmid replication protein RepC [Cereibacter azotoformans]PTR12533.1 replication initiation protein RepC [Cereibacter azotoformans]
MHHVSLTPFGCQPVTAAILAGQRHAQARPALPAIDKWSVFSALRTARARFDLGDRDLSVLYALLTFLPARELAEDAPLVVFPSNATLSERAHGMPESTLRRHIAALVRAGVVARRDSPNGKRYAHRDRSGALAQAFGFDLRPLLVRAAEIAEAAHEVEAEAEALSRARTTLVLRLRDATKLAAYARSLGQDPDSEPRLILIRRALRRRLAADELLALCRQVDAILSDIHRALHLGAEEPSGNDSQNERHHTSSEPDSLESEKREEAGQTEPPLPLALVLKACPELSHYAPDLRSWRDLCGAAARITVMMGITPQTWAEAQRTMGSEAAAVTVAAILQRFSRIRNPGGYLRNLSRRAAEGAFSPGPMVMALLSPAR